MEQKYLVLEDKLVLIFEELDKDSDEIKNKLNEDERNKGFYSTFYFSDADQYIWDESNPHTKEDRELYRDNPCFVIGSIEGNYIKLKKNIFKITENFYISKDLGIEKRYFYKHPNISIIRTLNNYAKSSIWIDTEEQYLCLEEKSQHISKKMFDIVLKKFPNQRQMELYKFSQIDEVLKDFFDTEDFSNKYIEYIEKRQKLKDKDFFDKQSAGFSYAGRIDLERNKAILEELNKLLNKEVEERIWQKELLPFIRLLFPQYIYVMDEVGILDTKDDQRRIDYILIDYDGNVDIVEMKTPQIQLLKKTQYRNNYVESTDLVGSIMQCEKYLFDLTSKKAFHEVRIKNKLKRKLKVDYEIHVNHPHAIVIAGRSNEFDDNQKADFQVIKRKYANIVDIISYDDLITRLRHMIESVSES